MRNGDAFMIGGGITLLPVGARQQVFSVVLNRPDCDLVLESIGAGTQQAGVASDTVEIFFNGAPIHRETVVNATGTSWYGLPFRQFKAEGTLEAYINNAGGVDSTKTVHLVGRYVPRD